MNPKSLLSDAVWALATTYVVFTEWELLAEVPVPNAVGLVVQAVTLVASWLWRSWGRRLA